MILVISVFVYGCAVPPAVSPSMEKSTSADVGKKTKKKIQTKKKVQTVKKQKKREESPKKVQGQGLAVDSAMEEVPAVEPEEAKPELVVGGIVYHYDYYPEPEVYFDTDRHLYFYNDNGRWVMSVALPTAFQVNLSTSVRMKLRTSQPYIFHADHRFEFPPDSGHKGF